MSSKLEKAHTFAVEHEAEIKTKYEHEKTVRHAMRTLRSAEKTQVRAVTLNAAEEAAEKASEKAAARAKRKLLQQQLREKRQKTAAAETAAEEAADNAAKAAATLKDATANIYM